MRGAPQASSTRPRTGRESGRAPPRSSAGAPSRKAIEDDPSHALTIEIERGRRTCGRTLPRRARRELWVENHRPHADGAERGDGTSVGKALDSQPQPVECGGKEPPSPV